MAMIATMDSHACKYHENIYITKLDIKLKYKKTLVLQTQIFIYPNLTLSSSTNRLWFSRHMTSHNFKRYLYGIIH